VSGKTDWIRQAGGRDMKQNHGPWAHPTPAKKREYRAMSAIFYIVVAVACATFANHVWGWV